MKLERDYKLVVNHKKILRSMRIQGLKTEIRKRKPKGYTSQTSVAKRAFPNRVQGNFFPCRADTIYSGDITEMRLSTYQKIYIHAVKDLYTKEIVSYNIGLSPDIPLVTDKFFSHLSTLSVRQRQSLIYHTDQGGVFMSDYHIYMGKSLNITQSMSRRGNCLDNSPIESFFGHMKDELSM